jgi:hypothetical protein
MHRKTRIGGWPARHPPASSCGVGTGIICLVNLATFAGGLGAIIFGAQNLGSGRRRRLRPTLGPGPGSLVGGHGQMTRIIVMMHCGRRALVAELTRISSSSESRPPALDQRSRKAKLLPVGRVASHQRIQLLMIGPLLGYHDSESLYDFGRRSGTSAAAAAWPPGTESGRLVRGAHGAH